MADSTTNLDLISANQSGKEVTANALFDAGSAATVLGRRASTTTALTWGYYGGNITLSDGSLLKKANGTLALTASSTNYIVGKRSDGDISSSTTSTDWNDPDYFRLYKVDTGANAVTSYEDHRQIGLITGGGGAVGALLAANNLSDLVSASTARTNLGLGSSAVLDVDTDGGLTANSDSEVPSQKAVKTYVDSALETVEGADILSTGATSGYSLVADGFGGSEWAPVYNMDMQDATVAALKFAIDQGALANYGVRALREQVQQEGSFTVVNRGVVSGCAATKSATPPRKLDLAAGVCFANGRAYSVASASAAAYVPENTTGGAVTVFAYLELVGGMWQLAVTPIGANLPAGAVKLYNVVIPDNSTDGTDSGLLNVTLTDVRRFEPWFPRLLDSPVSVSVVLETLPANDYRLDFDIVDAVGAPCESKCVVVSSRATNGFTVHLASAADDVIVRWKASRLNN